MTGANAIRIAVMLCSILGLAKPRDQGSLSRGTLLRSDNTWPINCHLSPWCSKTFLTHLNNRDSDSSFDNDMVHGRPKRWVQTVGIGLALGAQLLEMSSRSSSNQETSHNFQTAFSSLDRNYQAITSTGEKIDQLILGYQQGFDSLDQKIDFRAAETLTAVAGLSSKLDARVTDLSKTLLDIEKNNEERTITVMNNLLTLDQKNEQRADQILGAVRDTDMNNDRRANQTLYSIAAADNNNNERAALLMNMIITADMKNDERAGMLLAALNETDSNNYDRARLLLAAIAEADKRNDVKTAIILNGLYNLEQQNYYMFSKTLSEIDNLDKNVHLNFASLIQVFQEASRTYKAVEITRHQMNNAFDVSLALTKSSRVEPTISKLKNFIQYYDSEKDRICKLPRDERIAVLQDEHGFLQNLKNSRTPVGDSLQSFIKDVVNMGYAIPKDNNDTVAMSALSAVVYGCQTQFSVMYYLIQQYIYLADHCYRIQEIECYNKYIDEVKSSFEGFKHTLLGNDGIIDQIISLLKKVAMLEFIQREGKISTTQFMEQAASLENDKFNLMKVRLPIILDTPPKLLAQIKFDRKSPAITSNFSLGPWEVGTKVSYAVQYRSKENLYSKVGPWSTPYKITDRANPTLKITASSLYDRLIFRKFLDGAPELVGLLARGIQTKFIDIDRDLYNTGFNSDEDQALKEAEILLGNGANIKAEFDFGRNILHAAAINNNVKLAQAILQNNTVPVDLNAQDSNGYAPLHLAAEEGQVDFIEFLLEMGANPNVRSILGSTPLHLASSSGYNAALLAVLQSDEIDVNAMDNNGATPLHYAVKGGVLENIETLLSNTQLDPNMSCKGALTPLHLSSLIADQPEITSTLLKRSNINVNARSDNNLTALHLAVISGNVHAVQLMSQLNVIDMNPQSINDWTPLHYAVALQKDDIVFELLENSYVMINALGKGRITPLHLAATTGQRTIISQLINKGADLEVPTTDGLTAYHLAAVNNNHHAMKILALYGANINAKTLDGSTPLHLVAALGFSQTVSYILDMEQVKVNVKNEYKETALQLAERHGYSAIVALLKEKLNDESPPALMKMDGDLARRNERDRQALQEAARKGDLQQVQELLNKGVNVDAKDSDGCTALHEAARNGHTSIVTQLLDWGANVGARTLSGSTPLHMAAQHGNIQTVRYIMNADGCNINARDYERRTPLNIAEEHNNEGVALFFRQWEADVKSKLINAVKGGNLQELKALAKNGANLHTRTGFLNDTLLNVASSYGKLDVVKFLINEGCDVNGADNDGESSLHEAVWLGNLELIKYLVDQGANVRAKTNSGTTALYWAVVKNNLDAVVYLLENGADVHALRDSGETPLSLANKLKEQSILAHFESKGIK